jgi:hypothetical protein
MLSILSIWKRSNLFSLFVLILLGVMLASSSSQAWQAALEPAFRDYPLSGDVTASIKQEWMMFDHRSESDTLTYGLWQVKAAASVAGTVEASASVYPISFVRLTAGFGGTERYYNPATFNCSYVNCQGFFQKSRLGFGFVLATGENKQWVALPEYNLIQVGNTNNPLPTGDETELILANPTGDTLDQYQVVLGKKVESKIYGILLRGAHYRSSGQRNEMQALMAKANWRDTSFIIGAGRWASDMNVPGFTAFFTYEWRWGYSQALF